MGTQITQCSNNRGNIGGYVGIMEKKMETPV